MLQRTTRHVLAGLPLLTLLGFQEAGPPATDGAWAGDFEFGPHAVGFQTHSISRESPAGRRDLLLSVWYPADASRTDRLRLSEYFQVVLNEEQLSEPVGLEREAAFSAALTGSAHALSKAQARAGLDMATFASAEAPQIDGAFPIALWSSRHATVLAQVPLSELLASHGFVTASVWSSDPPLAFLWDDHAPQDKIATIESHAEDLERGLEYLRQRPDVDPDRVVVLSWSYGGQTAARLQEREPAVRGVIAFDANVVPSRPEESLDLKQPLLYLVGENTAGRGYESLQELAGTWTSVRFPGLAHGSFNALEGYLPALLGAETVFSWSQTGPVARNGYRAIARVGLAAAQTFVDGVPVASAPLASVVAQAAQDVPIEIISSGERTR
ncbi:MAG: hypothetical protein GKS06_11035 [Acidobacteria bacterium]|nr:hypothetical protein [Acidobacteriota bacterium]